MKNLLAAAAAGEVAMGLALLGYTPSVIWLLFGAEIAGAGILVGRVAGIGLIGLGVACWPSGRTCQQLYGMLTYSMLAALYLIYIGVGAEGGGVLLWPAILVHAILVVLLVGARSMERTSSVGGMAARSDHVPTLGGDSR